MTCSLVLDIRGEELLLLNLCSRVGKDNVTEVREQGPGVERSRDKDRMLEDALLRVN